ncbi:MAG: ABC transporter ATP-binding protein [Candidatus Magasanikbacteria bacterium]|nr:ABC transporter ATP-binding protein [Candidatus Magasanikbacteria bacterium]
MIEAKNIIKKFYNGTVETTILRGIDLSIANGEFVSIMGRSGAGKSTLLYQLGLLDHQNEGVIVLNGVDTNKLTSSQRAHFRLIELGYVFQDYAILPELTAIENTMVPLLMQGYSQKQARKIAMEALEKMGLANKKDNVPGQLSGGEQQRVSIARAIAHKPKILFADEPTANLDSETGLIVMKIFLELHKEGQTIVMVTHEQEYGNMTERIIHLSDGQIVAS